MLGLVDQNQDGSMLIPILIIIGVVACAVTFGFKTISNGQRVVQRFHDQGMADVLYSYLVANVDCDATRQNANNGSSGFGMRDSNGQVSVVSAIGKLNFKAIAKSNGEVYLVYGTGRPMLVCTTPN